MVYAMFMMTSPVILLLSAASMKGSSGAALKEPP